MTIERRIGWDGRPLAANGGDDAAGIAGPAGFDPGEHTVAEVEAYLAEHPDERDVVLEAELAGKQRTTLLAVLEADDASPEE